MSSLWRTQNFGYPATSVGTALSWPPSLTGSTLWTPGRMAVFGSGISERSKLVSGKTPESHQACAHRKTPTQHPAPPLAGCGKNMPAPNHPADWDRALGWIVASGSGAPSLAVSRASHVPVIRRAGGGKAEIVCRHPASTATQAGQVEETRSVCRHGHPWRA
jgi:hypothetical protein